MERQIEERAADLFSALGHAMRIRVTELLIEGEKTVNEIAAALGLHQSNTSQHLAILTRAGVLAVRRRGTSRYYRLRGPRVVRILATIEEFCKIHALYGAAGDEPSEGESGAQSGVSDREGVV